MLAIVSLIDSVSADLVPVSAGDAIACQEDSLLCPTPQKEARLTEPELVSSYN